MLQMLHAGPCAHFCTPVKRLLFCSKALVRAPVVARSSGSHTQASSSSAATTAAAAAAAAAAVKADQSPSVHKAADLQPFSDKRDFQSTDRKHKRKQNSIQPSTVLQEGAAAVAGPLPDVLAATFPETFPTLSAARRVIRKDLILVDGALGSCKTDVSAGQQLQQLEPVSKSKGPRVVSLQVLYEDDDLAVVHKPWGVKMYGGDARRTITGALKAGALQPSTAEDALPEPKPLHRLDAAVGGVLLIAKTAAAAADISLQFVERRVHKVYHALLCGRLIPGTQPQQQQQQQADAQQSIAESASMSETQRENESMSDTGSNTQSETQSDSEDQQDSESAQLLPLPELLQRQLQGNPAFTVTLQDLADPVLLSPEDAAAAAAAAAAADNVDSISSSSSSSTSVLTNSSTGNAAEALASGVGEGVYVVDLPVEGKPSYSLYQVLGYSRSSRYGGWVTSVALSPVTGRKHQLRKHMAALGCPIVGDGKYALNKDEHIGNQGIYLESLEIAFAHPSTQQRLHVRMPEPQRFATLRQQLYNKWKKMSQIAARDAAAARDQQAEPQQAGV